MLPSELRPRRPLDNDRGFQRIFLDWKEIGDDDSPPPRTQALRVAGAFLWMSRRFCNLCSILDSVVLITQVLDPDSKNKASLETFIGELEFVESDEYLRGYSESCG